MRKFTHYLDEPVNVLKLIDELSFDPDDVEQASVDQPKLYIEAGKWRVQQMRKRSKALANLEVVTAEAGLKERRKKSSQPRGERLTDAAIKDMVQLDKRVRKARMRTERAFAREEFGKILLTAFAQRQSATQVIAKVRASEMSNDLRKTKSNMARDEMSKRARKVRERYDAIGEDDED